MNENFKTSMIYNVMLDEYLTFNTGAWTGEMAMTSSMLKTCEKFGTGDFDANYNELHAAVLNTLGWVRRIALTHENAALATEYKRMARTMIRSLARIRKYFTDIS